MSNFFTPSGKLWLMFLSCAPKAAYGTAKSGVGIASMGVMRPDMIMSPGFAIWVVPVDR